MYRIAFTLSALVMPLVLSVPAAGQTPTAASSATPTLGLSANAQREVLQDRGRLVLFAERQGKRPEAAAADVNRRLDAARTLAKRTPELTVSSGTYSTYPIYTDDKLVGYRVRGELVIESGNLQALSVLSGDLQPDMQVESLAFSVSDEVARKVRAALVQETADAFAAKAQAATRAFGYSGYRIREIQLMDDGNVMPMMYARGGMASEMAAKSSVPMEPGKEQLIVRAQGTVELLK